MPTGQSAGARIGIGSPPVGKNPSVASHTTAPMPARRNTSEAITSARAAPCSVGSGSWSTFHRTPVSAPVRSSTTKTSVTQKHRCTMTDSVTETIAPMTPPGPAPLISCPIATPTAANGGTMNRSSFSSRHQVR